MIVKLTIRDFPRYVKLSEQRRKKYFIKGKGKPPPRKYKLPRYGWKKFKNDLFMFDFQEQEKVVANPLTAGTPRLKKINGQAIYNASADPFTRNKMMHDLHDFFIAEFKKANLEPFKDEDLPLLISGELFMPYYEAKGKDWDVDNIQYPYVKAFHDSLVLGGYLEDDHRGIIPQPLHFKYTPAKYYKMVITFSKDRRKVWKKSLKQENS